MNAYRHALFHLWSKQLEELKLGVFHHIDHWNTPNDLTELLLAAKICSKDSHLVAEGVGYAQKAIDNAKRADGHLKCVGFRMLGLCLGKQAKVSCFDFERSRLQSEALKSLDKAISFEQDNADLIFELGVQHSEQQNLTAALRYAKKYIDVTDGSVLKGWRLLAVVLFSRH
ncbi:hypothetical protein PTKIN_Ptkin07bG0059600 [Pterospermum kingtungense]